MKENEFWGIIDAARRDVGWHRPRWQGLLEYDDYADRIAEAAVQRLAVETLDRILAFDRVLWRLLTGESYRWDLWAAGYLINGGCSAEGFNGFRGWVMAHGRDVWRRALMDPDILVELVPADAGPAAAATGEHVLAIAAQAYEQAGGDLEHFRVATRAAREDAATAADPAGQPIDFADDAQMRRRLPKLCARFGRGGDV